MAEPAGARRFAPTAVVSTAVCTVGAMVAVLAPLSMATAAPVVAGPATTVSYASGASATMYSGPAFDTCAAPPLTTMSAWLASPYRAIGVYIGGVNRTCAQPQLTAPWVKSVSVIGWRLLPVYKGPQAPCGGKPTDVKINPATAAAQGKAAADDAAVQATALGMLGGSGLYVDMETYTTGNASCRSAVLTYLSAWTTEVHKLGYVAGVYAQLASGATDLAGVYRSTSYARPDAIWIARYDGNATLSGWAGIPDADWAQNQRAKQYNNSHTETYGSVPLNIDNDVLNSPVASVSYGYQVISSTPLSTRSGPGTNYPVVATYAPGTVLAVACQAHGGKVGTTSVWDKLAGGSYVTDLYVGTPSKTGYSAPLPRCSYPYQAITNVNMRTGPGVSYRLTGQLPNGSLVWLSCQARGTKVGSTSVWDKMLNGRWVSDNYVSAPNRTGFSKPAPGC